MTTRYKYVTLRHQHSLDSKTENFAVLVEGRAPSGWCIFAVGRSPENRSAVTEVGRAIRRKFLEILAGVVEQVDKDRGSVGDVLGHLHEYLRWSYQATQAATVEDGDPIEQVAFKLFGEQVARASQLVTQLRTASGLLQTESIGEMFAAAVPIPDPARDELFATV